MDPLEEAFRALVGRRFIRGDAYGWVDTSGNWEHAHAEVVQVELHVEGLAPILIGSEPLMGLVLEQERRRATDMGEHGRAVWGHPIVRAVFDDLADRCVSQVDGIQHEAVNLGFRLGFGDDEVYMFEHLDAFLLARSWPPSARQDAFEIEILGE